MKKVLTIAGSDCSGGAGLQADLKTFCAHGVYGMSVVTSITAQNTAQVLDIQNASTYIIAKQLDAIFNDINVDAVKIGMVSTAEIINVITNKLKQYNIQNIVVDPVMVSTSGHNLLACDAKNALINKLIPISKIVTPNIPEAEVITQTSISTVEDMKKAAKAIYSIGADYVLVKGGHLKDNATDILFDGQNFKSFTTKKIQIKDTHGTGCTLSSSIASNIAKGFSVADAVLKAKDYVTSAIKNSKPIGKGAVPLNHMFKYL